MFIKLTENVKETPRDLYMNTDKIKFFYWCNRKSCTVILFTDSVGAETVKETPEQIQNIIWFEEEARVRRDRDGTTNP